MFCHYFVYQQRPEDRILAVLVRKTETIKQELGSLAQVIDARLAETLKRGIRRDAVDALEREIEAADLDPDRRQAVDEELEASPRTAGGTAQADRHARETCSRTRRRASAWTRTTSARPSPVPCN